jgi:hypothetical protein
MNHRSFTLRSYPKLANHAVLVCDFSAPSLPFGRFAPAPPIGLSGRIRAPARSGSGLRAGPAAARAVPRLVTVWPDHGGHCLITVWPDHGGHGGHVGGDVTRGRDHRPPALPPGPRACCFHSTEYAGGSRAPTGVCQGLRALTQRSPCSGPPSWWCGFKPARRTGGGRQSPATSTLCSAVSDERPRGRVRSDARRRLLLG